MWYEHIITLQDNLAIELDCRKSIQTIECEYVDCTILDFGDLRQINFIGPSLVCNPFCIELIES